MDPRTTQITPEDLAKVPGRHDIGLLIAWTSAEPDRLGEVAFLPSGAFDIATLGRGGARPDDPGPRLSFVRQRPLVNEPTDPLTDGSVSRVQLEIRRGRRPALLEVANRGRSQLRVNGMPRTDAPILEGDVLTVGRDLSLLCVVRPRILMELKDFPATAMGPFGLADETGLVGESAAAWAIRDRLAFAAHRDRHALIVGPSGSGKEIVARAIYQLSSRGGRPFVSRNAATIPESLADAELFGHAAGYPNAGMPARKGLVGEADGGVLFLDEIGELSEPLQARLLRVLDSRGEYTRLGESGVRRSSFRLIGATNRPLQTLRADLAARLALRLEVPDLNSRRDDIPLLVRHLLATAARSDERLAERFFIGAPGPRTLPRLAEALIVQLLRHQYTTHVRELEGMLWQSLSAADGDRLEALPAVARATSSTTPPETLTREAVIAALEAAGGKPSKAWQILGLASRFQLHRLIKRYGLEGTRGKREPSSD